MVTGGGSTHRPVVHPPLQGLDAGARPQRQQLRRHPLLRTGPRFEPEPLPAALPPPPNARRTKVFSRKSVQILRSDHRGALTCPMIPRNHSRKGHWSVWGVVYIYWARMEVDRNRTPGIKILFNLNHFFRIFFWVQRLLFRPPRPTGPRWQLPEHRLRRGDG